MLAQRNPHEVYRRIDFDARVSGATPGELVAVCYEQLVASLGSALWAHERGDNQTKSQSLTRALAALTALQMGVQGANAVADALHHVYMAARRALLDSVLAFNPATIAHVRQDFRDIAESLARANTGLN
jgi:flagellar protein FliS